jgi:hypothetical protein
MKLYVAEESIRRLGKITLYATANGAPLSPAVYDTPGMETYVRELHSDTGTLDLHFRLDKSLPSEATDDRERGIIVASIHLT